MNGCTMSTSNHAPKPSEHARRCYLQNNQILTQSHLDEVNNITTIGQHMPQNPNNFVSPYKE